MDARTTCTSTAVSDIFLPLDTANIIGPHQVLTQLGAVERQGAIFYSQVSCTVFVAGPETVGGTIWVKVPVSVTGPFVGALQTAVPLVKSSALLIWIAAGSGFDQVAYSRATIWGIAHPA